MKIPFLGLEITRRNRGRTVPPSSMFRSLRSARSYAAAASNRLTEDWQASQTSADAEIEGGRRKVTDRVRQQERDNPLVSSALRLFENNVVGAFGVDLQMKVMDFNGTLDNLANAQIETAWFNSGKPKNCCVNRSQSRVMLLYQVIDSVVRDGGILLRKYRGFDNAFKYALQPLEIDYLDHDFNRDATATENAVRFGIETDRFGAPVAYHLFTRHPGETFFGRGGRTLYRERVPADDIFPVWDIRTRAGQMVGMPRFSSTLTTLKHLERYSEAELVAACEASCKGYAIEKTVPGEWGGEVTSGGEKLAPTEPGMGLDLMPGEKYVPIDPTHPNTAFDGFTKAQVRRFARGIGLSYMAVSGDLSETNFSSGRMGATEDRREYRKLQWSVLIEQLLQPWFEDWLPYALMSGQIRLPISKLDKFNAATWQPQGWEWIQPKEEIEANKAAIGAGIRSRKQVIAEQGGDIEDVDADNAADKGAFPDGVDYSQNYAPPGSQPKPVEPNEDDDEETKSS